jgi:nucleoside-diphosphate-sugar epimerase
MSILVTGGTGFLGSRLVRRLLEAGCDVTVLARSAAPELESKGARLVRASVEDASAVADACRGAETVFHVAAKVGVWGDRETFERVNVGGTRNVIAGCRRHGVPRLVHTSTPSVVYNGRDIAGADESLPLTTHCPSPYALTKAAGEREVLAANGDGLATVALRPHLVWGVGDPHLVPRVLERARQGRLRIVGAGTNKVDMVHVENAVDAHLLAARALGDCHVLRDNPLGTISENKGSGAAAGRAYFITNGEPVVLWEWINDLLRRLGRPPVTRRISLVAASAIGAACEIAWRGLGLGGEPPMTRFVAAELAKDHWFDISAARRDLGYSPRVTMEQGTKELVANLKSGGAYAGN